MRSSRGSVPHFSGQLRTRLRLVLSAVRRLNSGLSVLSKHSPTESNPQHDYLFGFSQDKLIRRSLASLKFAVKVRPVSTCALLLLLPSRTHHPQL